MKIKWISAARFKSYIWFGAALLIFSFTNAAFAQQERVLDSIEYGSFAGHAVIRINFTKAVAYRKHFPLKQGITIDVGIRLVEPRDQSQQEQSLVPTEVLLAPDTRDVPLAGVTYDETDPANPVVVVRFTKAVDYSVKIDNSQRALLIELPQIQYQVDVIESGTFSEPGQLLTLEDINASKQEDATTLLAMAKEAISGERFDDAIQLLNAILNLPDHALNDAAEELLVEARFRARSLAFAETDTPTPTPKPEPAPPQIEAPSLQAEAAATQEPSAQVAEAVTPRARAPGSSAYERQLDFGRMALSRGDFRGAMRIFSLVLAAPEDHPFKSEAQRLLAETEQKINQHASQDPSAQEPKREQVQPSQPDSVSAEQQAAQWLEQAQAALEVGDAITAVSLLEKVIETPGHALGFEAQRMLDQARIVAAKQPKDTAPPTQSAQPNQAEDSARTRSATATPLGAQDINEIEDAAVLMAMGREAMKRNDMQLASRIFSRILNLPVSSSTPEAERLLRQTTRQNMRRSTDLRAPIVGDPTTLDDVVRMMEQGKLAITESDYNRAIVIFTKLTSIPEHPHSKEALEMLGVSRQRNNQLAHAKAVFQQYIEKYPEGEDSVRVKQRLAELISSQMRPKVPMSQDQRRLANSADFRHDTFGSLSQYYYYGITAIETFTEDREDQSSLISYMTLNSRSRNDRYDLRTFFYGTHTKDFLADPDDQERSDRVEISTAYFDGKDSRIGLSGRVGRQSSNTPGVLGRFDGVLVGLDVLPQVHLNLAAGFPVDLNRKDSIATETNFVAFNVEFDDWVKNLDVIPYVSVQQSEGLLDRVAIGEEVRYFNPRGSFFNLLDYDASYGSLNIFLLHGQLNFGTNSSIHFNYDYRNSPILTTRSALINQPTYPDLTALQADFDEETIRAMAEERTGKSSIATFGINYSINETFQVSNDFTWTSTAYSPDQLAVSPELVASEDSLQWNGRLTTNGLLWPREISILSLGYTTAETYDNLSFSVQNRAPFGEGWSVDTRLRTDFRSDTRGEELTRIRPSAKLAYSWKRKITLEVEAGIEFSKYGGVTNNRDSDRTFGSFGYRWMF